MVCVRRIFGSCRVGKCCGVSGECMWDAVLSVGSGECMWDVVLSVESVFVSGRKMEIGGGEEGV